ncbi:D-alanyl-D-alanine carboxypeptidase family protein [Streptomyces sp. NPDC092296]|uniref:D-alanyl-D-alanine carboxypeptidase family protein n=1 Tax=Streptomyces sp. NPDC092296 TaxID=3366012 RepID=UPI003830EC8C
MTSADDLTGSQDRSGIPPATGGTGHRRRTASALLAVVAASAAILSGALPAAAKPTGEPTAGATKKARKHPVPPERMSTVGGEQLGLPGVRIQPGDGAPELPEQLTGLSWIVSDATTGEVLAAQNAHWRLPPASTLKMLFADTVLPKFPRGTTHRVTPEELADMGEGSSLVGIKEHLDYRVEDLWRGVFLRSGNDAVHVLAHMNGGIPETVAQMQARADELQADDTHVVSPDGYDAPGQVSSAYDLTLFARAGLRNADFRSYCATATAKFPGDVDSKTHKRESFEIQNTDRLLTGAWGMKPYPGLLGVKNGYTTNAGNTFTGAAERDGHTLIVTVMHPEPVHPNEVYIEAGELLDWGFSALGKVTPVGSLVGPRSEQSPSPSATPPTQQAGPSPAAAGTTTVEAGSTSTGGGSLGWTAAGVAAALAVGGLGVARTRARTRRRAAAWASSGPSGSTALSASPTGSTAVTGRRRRRRLPTRRR